MSRLDELAKVIRDHRKCERWRYSYRCICGEKVASNSHHVQSKHIAEKVMDWIKEQ